jgi:hypothetical protein
MYRAIARRQADAGRLDNDGFRQTQGAGPLCNDRTAVAGRLGAGADVVVLSPPEEGADSAASQSRLNQDRHRGVDLLDALAE